MARVGAVRHPWRTLRSTPAGRRIAFGFRPFPRWERITPESIRQQFRWRIQLAARHHRRRGQVAGDVQRGPAHVEEAIDAEDDADRSEEHTSELQSLMRI